VRTQVSACRRGVDSDLSTKLLADWKRCFFCPNDSLKCRSDVFFLFKMIERAQFLRVYTVDGDNFKRLSARKPVILSISALRISVFSSPVTLPPCPLSISLFSRTSARTHCFPFHSPSHPRRSSDRRDPFDPPGDRSALLRLQLLPPLSCSPTNRSSPLHPG
jgi:hypothetical protein